MTEEVQRTPFERARGFSGRKFTGGHYVDPWIEEQWQTWQAALSQGGWVSVEDVPARCDGFERRIKLRDGSELDGAILQSDGDWWWRERYLDPSDVTHWQPLKEEPHAE